MLEPNFNPFPVLETERLVLRRLGETDLAELFFMRSDERIMIYIDQPRFTKQEEAIAYLEKLDKIQEENEGINWAVTLKGEPKLIGRLCLFNFAKEHFRGELGYVILPRYHGKGIAQEAVEAVLEYGFKQIRLHTIEANVNPANEASIRVLERNHFVREAYFRENYFFEGKFLDSAVYSLINPY
jgi:ribosomal-protein-alanine N-acetyltransferase